MTAPIEPPRTPYDDLGELRAQLRAAWAPALERLDRWAATGLDGLAAAFVRLVEWAERRTGTGPAPRGAGADRGADRGEEDGD